MMEISPRVKGMGARPGHNIPTRPRERSLVNAHVSGGAPIHRTAPSRNLSTYARTSALCQYNRPACTRPRRLPARCRCFTPHDVRPTIVATVSTFSSRGSSVRIFVGIVFMRAPFTPPRDRARTVCQSVLWLRGSSCPHAKALHASAAAFLLRSRATGSPLQDHDTDQ